MDIEKNVNELAALIEKNIHPPIALNTYDKTGLHKFLGDFIELVETPENESVYNTVFYSLHNELGQLFRLQENTQLDNTTVTTLCCLAAQLVAMRGYIKLKRRIAFHTHPFLRMHNSSFKKNQYSINEWSKISKGLLTHLKEQTLLLHMCIANHNENTNANMSIWQADENESKNYLLEKNCYNETALEHALRLQNTSFANNIMLQLTSNLSNTVAFKMALIINHSGLSPNIFKNNIKMDLFQKNLSQMIHQLIAYNIISITPASVDNLEKSHHYASTDGISLLKHIDFKLDCESEIEEAFSMLKTILDKLQDEKARETFLGRDNNGCPIQFAQFSPAILCTLSFRIAALIGNQSDDKAFDMLTYTILFNKIFPNETIIKADLSHWQTRIFMLFNLMRPLKKNEKNLIDDIFDGSKNLTEEDATAQLLIAAYNNDNLRLKNLLLLGANPNIQHGLRRRTVLHIVVASNNIEGASILVNHKTIDLTIKDFFGRTPYDYAASMNNSTWANQETLIEEMRPPSIAPYTPLRNAYSNNQNDNAEGKRYQCRQM